MMTAIKINKRKLTSLVARLRKLQEQADDLVAAELDDDVFGRRNAQWTDRWSKLLDDLTEWYGSNVAPQMDQLHELTDPSLFDERIESVLDRIGAIGSIAPGPLWDADSECLEETPAPDANAEDAADGELSGLADELESLTQPVELEPAHRAALEQYEHELRAQADLIRKVLS